MELLEIWKGDADRSYALLQEIPAEERGFENPAHGMERDAYEGYLAGLEREAAGEGLPEGWVDATKYLIVGDDGTYLGILNLRHRLTPALAAGAGHIGYAIAPAWRGRGYATEALRLGLACARDLHGIECAYLSVCRDNPASLAVQLKCGAAIHHEDETHIYTRISTDTDRMH